MNAADRSRVAIEIVPQEIPWPATKTTGVSLASVPLELLRKYSSPKPVRRPAPRSKEKPEHGAKRDNSNIIDGGT